MTRGLDDLLADLAEAADAAAELVDLGKERWDSERPLRLAGEAVIGRLGDLATKLPDEVIKAMPEIPWREVKGMRIIAAHAYHRIDYEEVWVLCATTFPEWTRRSNVGDRHKLDRLDTSRWIPGTLVSGNSSEPASSATKVPLPSRTTVG